MKNCLKAFQQYKGVYNCETGNTKHGALANILICLEKAVQDGNGDGLCCYSFFIYILDLKCNTGNYIYVVLALVLIILRF